MLEQSFNRGARPMTLKETLVDYIKFLPKAGWFMTKVITKYSLIFLAGAIVMFIVLYLMNIQQEHVFAQYRLLYPWVFN